MNTPPRGHNCRSPTPHLELSTSSLPSTCTHSPHLLPNTSIRLLFISSYFPFLPPLRPWTLHPLPPFSSPTCAAFSCSLLLPLFPQISFSNVNFYICILCSFVLSECECSETCSRFFACFLSFSSPPSPSLPSFSSVLHPGSTQLNLTSGKQAVYPPLP